MCEQLIIEVQAESRNEGEDLGCEEGESVWAAQDMCIGRFAQAQTREKPLARAMAFY